MLYIVFFINPWRSREAGRALDNSTPMGGRRPRDIPTTVAKVILDFRRKALGIMPVQKFIQTR